MRISCAGHLTMRQDSPFYSLLFFFENVKWNSLGQGHDDEQHTTIFQKALLVANQVWMGLNEPNTQKAPPWRLGSRLDTKVKQTQERADKPFRRLTWICIKPNNQDMRNQYLITWKKENMWRLSRNWQKFDRMSILITASEPPVVLNFDPGHPNQWGRLPCRTVALHSFDLVASADENNKTSVICLGNKGLSIIVIGLTWNRSSRRKIQESTAKEKTKSAACCRERWKKSSEFQADAEDRRMTSTL